MRTLHVISGDMWAGAEAQVYYTVRELSRLSRHQITCLVFNDGELYNRLKDIHIETVLLDEKLNNNIQLIVEIIKYIKILRPELIHVHAVKEHFLIKMALLLKRYTIPIMRTVHGARKAPENLPFKKMIRSNSVVALDNYLITHASEGLIAVSSNLKEEFIRSGAKGCIFPIPNAIDITDYDLPVDAMKIRQKFSIKGSYWIGTAARLAEPKNLSMLIRAAEIIKKKGCSFALSIFGQGPLRQELRNLIDDLSLSDQVILHGFESDIIPIIKSFDVFVLCSVHEGLPMVLLEAFALRTPVVGTNVVGINEVVINGDNGLLVPLNDHAALAESILLLCKDRVMAEKLADSGNDMVQETFSIKKIIAQVDNAYTQLKNKEGG